MIILKREGKGGTRALKVFDSGQVFCRKSQGSVVMVDGSVVSAWMTTDGVPMTDDQHARGLVLSARAHEMGG